jgi:hypothetical protein
MDGVNGLLTGRVFVVFQSLLERHLQKLSTLIFFLQQILKVKLSRLIIVDHFAYPKADGCAEVRASLPVFEHSVQHGVVELHCRLSVLHTNNPYQNEDLPQHPSADCRSSLGRGCDLVCMPVQERTSSFRPEQGLPAALTILGNSAHKCLLTTNPYPAELGILERTTFV